MTLVHIVIALGLIEFFVFLMAVGRARGTYQLPAPATTGNEMFERYFRVQMNTHRTARHLPALDPALRPLRAPAHRRSARARVRHRPLRSTSEAT